MSDTDEFLKTLKIHNKDLNACFNDSVAVTHLRSLLTQEAKLAERQQKLVPVFIYAALWFTVGLFVGAAL